MKQKIENKINLIMSKFDFDAVNKYMISKDWMWANNSGGMSVPTIEELKETAKSLLNNLLESEYSSSCSRTGGFCATKFTFNESIEIRLAFELENYSSSIY